MSCGEPCDGCIDRATHHLCDSCVNADIDRLKKELQDARAEVERLREVVRKVHALAGAMDKWPDVIDLKECGAKIHKLTKEHP